MLKSILAALGVLAVIGGVAVWQFGFLSDQAEQASKKIDRATAAARAGKAIAETKAKVGQLDEQARKYRIDARALELAWEREQESTAKLEAAMKALATAAKEAGLPSPSERDALTDEQKKIALTFGGKKVDAADVYSTLDRWSADLEQKRSIADQKKATFERMFAVSEQLTKKKGEMEVTVAKLEGRLKELETAKDLASVNAELASMEANVEGVDVGKLGGTLETLQGEIDELNAQASVYQDETNERDAALQPTDVIEPVSNDAALDALWN
jgi:chromosome segregation ATPase